MIHPDTKHHEELAALPFALTITAILWPWIKAYLARKETSNNNTNTNDKDTTP